MSSYKSKEFVPSDSSSDEDENVKPKVKTPEVSPVKEKKQKKEKKAKKNKEEKVKKSKKDKKEKRIKEEKSPKKKRELTKRPLSSASEADDFEDVKPQKKARPEPKKPKTSSNSGSSAMTEDPTEGAIPLGKNRFVAVRCFKGKQYLDIREYFMNGNGQMQPGKKGVTLKRPQWEHLKDSFFDIDDKLRGHLGNEDHEPVDFGMNKRLAVTKFKGKYILIDIREMYQKDGEDRPGKGIALNPEQYNNIKNNADEIDKLW